MTWERLLRQRYNYNEIERVLPTERLSFRRKLLSCPPGVNVVPPEQQLPTHLPLQPTPLQVMRHGCSLYNDDLTGDITSRKGGPELQTLPISVSGKEVAKVSRRPRPSWMHWILAQGGPVPWCSEGPHGPNTFQLPTSLHLRVWSPPPAPRDPSYTMFLEFE